MAIIYVTPDGQPQWHDGRLIEGEDFQNAIYRAEPGDIVKLLPGVYEQPVVIRDKIAPADNPITIVGHSTTTLDGRRNPVRPPGIAEKEFYAFVKILNSRGIVLKNMTIQNVWPTAVYIEESQHIRIDKLNLNGATYGIFARGPTTEHLIVEHSSWIQDERIWDDVDWYDIHEAPNPRRELDGDFFRTSDIRGNVIIRHNFIAQAFNGVHFFAPELDDKGNPVEPGTFNTNVWVYRNTFTFIRDNAVEAENTATNWWVFENRIYNCHKWFAFERCDGGFLYIFANRGWFDRLPGPPGDCYTGGAVFKTNKIKARHEAFRLPQNPVYAFNNSWYVRSTYIKKGKLKNFHHFNNAIEYAKAEYHHDGVVQPGRKMIGIGGSDPVCDGPAEPDRSLTAAWGHLNITFENDVCNHPDYPVGVNAQGYPVRGTHAEPEFDSARIGEFGIVDTSPCHGTGISKTLDLVDGGTWTLPDDLSVGAMYYDEDKGEQGLYSPEALNCPDDALPDEYAEEMKRQERVADQKAKEKVYYWNKVRAMKKVS